MRIDHRAKKLSAVALCALAIVPQMIAWGNEGHMWINRAAALDMPADYPLFMRRPQAVAELTYLGPEPDRWRSTTEPSLKNEQEPEHFIDMELLADFGPLPPRRFDYYRKLEEYQHQQQAKGMTDKQLRMLTPDKIGLQPWIAAEMWQRLIVAFRQYRELRKVHKPTAAAEASALLYAGLLGHYVADASNPLHTTVQYNGWTGPDPNNYTRSHEIHYQFESKFVKDNIKADEVRHGLRKPTPLNAANEEMWQTEWDAYLAYLRTSNEQVEHLYQLEKTGAFEGKGTPEGHEFVVDRLRAGAQELADLWYTAWRESEHEPPPYTPNNDNKSGARSSSAEGD